jgi:ribosomal protein S17E
VYFCTHLDHNFDMNATVVKLMTNTSSIRQVNGFCKYIVCFYTHLDRNFDMNATVVNLVAKTPV